MTRRLLPLVVLSVLTLVGCREGVTALDQSPSAGMDELFGAARSIAQFGSEAVFARACWDGGSQRGCVGVVQGRRLRERDLRTFLFYTVSRCVRGVRGASALLRILALADSGRDSVPPDTTPRDTMPRDTVPRDTVPRDTVPRDTIPPDTVPPDTIRPDSLPRRCFPVEAGYGEIPDRHVIASPPEEVSVATNTGRSVNPRFRRLVGEGGRVVVKWHRVRDTLPDTLSRDIAVADQFALQPGPAVKLVRARVSGHVVGVEIVNPLFAYIGWLGPVTVAVGTTAARPR